MLSTGYRYLSVGFLTLLMIIPLFLAAAVIEDRSRLADRTRNDVGREWGGEQILTGSALVVPVEGDVTRKARRERPDADGVVTFETVTIRERGRVEPVVILPETLDVAMSTRTDIRSRGIFDVPVYTADISLNARFDPSRIQGALDAGERPIWDEAVLRMGLSSNSGLRGETRIEGPDGPLELEPFATGTGSGIVAAFGGARREVAAAAADVEAMAAEGGASTAAISQAPRGAGIEAGFPLSEDPFEIDATFTLNGAQRLLVSPVGRDSAVRMSGDRAAPSFTGAFLPDAREVTENGYEASWTIPHLARNLPQTSRGSFTEARAFSFGTEFVRVNDFYQKAFRAARYGVLFVALTFLTILLIERRGAPTHPVQYVLIGLVQAIFVLLMVAYAEQIGFLPAYLLSAGATTALLTMFGWIALGLGRRTLVLGAALAVVYTVLYMILQSTDLALLAGATLAFGALALTMIATRNENWYGEGGPGRFSFTSGPPARPDASTAPPPAPTAPPPSG
ncbi:cell envelope integrity protein CreD [Jannaschia aquimarina]|uniref:CreD protein n=1 Tax=Jannaschia aquimarina TaxID=935700 RepID=A0A0D1EJ36_9RHOB|nr:cell envelope integrity protein CreD [Jannaschia aquimarina]KIT17644.1 Inner membrane protein CreD [Jannaschia aquimarina]SNS80112.1 inner membrane protein [Jannaschia aquimarina]